ncbi:MAG: hypothetical protein CV090_13060, partial [Nitrospira sp. WS238]|nr:hypothetical protein [Nitrospira sp. WS238]
VFCMVACSFCCEPDDSGPLVGVRRVSLVLSLRGRPVETHLLPCRPARRWPVRRASEGPGEERGANSPKRRGNKELDDRQGCGGKPVHAGISVDAGIDPHHGDGKWGLDDQGTLIEIGEWGEKIKEAAC